MVLVLRLSLVLYLSLVLHLSLVPHLSLVLHLAKSILRQFGSARRAIEEKHLR